MLPDSCVTLHCQNISSCHTDYNEPIVGFILLLGMTWCGLLGWFTWLTHLWGMWPSHNDVCLGGKAHWCYTAISVAAQDGSYSIIYIYIIYISIWCMCIYIGGGGGFCVACNVYQLVEHHDNTWFRTRCVHGVSSPNLVCQPHAGEILNMTMWEGWCHIYGWLCHYMLNMVWVMLFSHRP